MLLLLVLDDPSRKRAYAQRLLKSPATAVVLSKRSKENRKAAWINEASAWYNALRALIGIKRSEEQKVKVHYGACAQPKFSDKKNVPRPGRATNGGLQARRCSPLSAGARRHVIEHEETAMLELPDQQSAHSRPRRRRLRTYPSLCLGQSIFRIGQFIGTPCALIAWASFQYWRVPWAGKP